MCDPSESLSEEENSAFRFLGHFDLLGLCLRSATGRDSVNSATSPALFPSPEELRPRSARKQPLAAVLRCLHVRNVPWAQLGPHRVHRTATQPQLGHRRAVVLRINLHSLRGALHQCRSVHNSAEMPRQQLLVSRHQPEASNDVHEGTRSKRKCQSARLCRGKWPADAGVQPAVASFVGDPNTSRHHAALRL